MDLKALENLRSVSQTQRQGFKQDASKYLNNGYDYLAQAGFEENANQQKALLLKSFDSFQQAIRYERQNAEAYIGLAIITFWAGSYADAQAYLNKAEELEPNHPDLAPLTAELLLKQFQAEWGQGPPESAAVHEVDEADFDALYDETESYLSETLEGLKKYLPLMNMTLDSEKYIQASQILKKFNAKFSKIHKNLEILESEFDVAPLNQQLKPLEMLRKQAETQLQISEALIQLKQALSEQTETIVTMTEAMRGDLSDLDLEAVDAQLEAFLDQSDAFADQIDSFEAKGYPVTELLSLYEKMSKKFQTLEDLCEDLQNE